jgi:hypothetical protein
VSTDSTLAPSSPKPGRAPSASACEPYRELIAEALGRGRNAMGIWQDLVDELGFGARYASVRRFVARLRKTGPPEARVVIVTGPGEEAQVDYGEGPMVRHPEMGNEYNAGKLSALDAADRLELRFLAPWRDTRTTLERQERAWRRKGPPTPAQSRRWRSSNETSPPETTAGRGCWRRCARRITTSSFRHLGI